jgi:hypothetical protein
VRYTARQGGAQLRDKAVAHLNELVAEASQSGLILLLSLNHDFPSEWHTFVTGNAKFAAAVTRDFIPYFTQSKGVVISAMKLYAIKAGEVQSQDVELLTRKLNEEGAFELSLGENADLARRQHVNVFVLIKYSLESV